MDGNGNLPGPAHDEASASKPLIYMGSMTTFNVARQISWLNRPPSSREGFRFGSNSVVVAVRSLARLLLHQERTFTRGPAMSQKVESRMGAVAWAIRQRSVSHPRSSNRTCRVESSSTGDPRLRGALPIGDIRQQRSSAGSDSASTSLAFTSVRQN